MVVYPAMPRRAYITFFAPLLLGLFFVGATPALAGTANLSFDASFGAQPFSYYCQPYKYSFESGKHYMMAPHNPPCFFSIPYDITGIKTIALYKGVPGNATGVAADRVIGGSPTLVQEYSTVFVTPTQDQDYFAVVYGYVSDSEAAQFDSAFRTGSSTNTQPPTNDFHILQWKWGAKPVSEYEPVVIIPGILGSWEKNGDWVLDPIAHTYDNLVDTFLANGYVEGKTLFKFGYDWEEPNEVTASVLANKIKDIKQICGCQRVNLIAHSMGGLVAEQYIESSEYGNDVGQLFLVATPLMGAPKAYKAWEGGDVDFGRPVENAFMQTKFWLEAEGHGYTNVFDYIRGNPIESIQELLPDYDYLYDNTVGLRTYPTGYPVNGFLDTLMANIGKVLRGVQTSIILADNSQGDTPSSFLLKDSTQLPRWGDGEITDTFYDLGDGVVPRASIENLTSADKEFDGVDHLGVVSTSSSYIFEKLNNKTADPVINKSYNAITSFIWFTLHSPIDMQIVAPDGKLLGKDFSTNTEVDGIPDAFYSGFNTDNEYAVIVNPLPGKYEVKTVGTGSGGTYMISADYFNGSTTTEAQLVGSTTPLQIIGHTVTISSTTTTVTISTDVPLPPPDTQAPVVIITSPQASKQYTHADTIKISAIITDQSPIATTTYKFNGKLVGSSTPILLATAPLGTSTVLVIATDSFGNVGSSSVSLQIVATPDSCETDVVLAYKNKWITKKAVYDTLIARCEALKGLFKDRDAWYKIPLLKRDKKTQQSLASTLGTIQSLFDDINKWIKDKSNTKDALQLLNQNLQWFKNHQPNQ